jgi:hypothetical protein
VQDVALVGAVEVLGDRADPAALAACLEGHLTTHHVPRPVGGDVRRPAARHRRVLVRREPVGGGDGVAPRDIAVETDVDHRRTDQARPRHVVLPRDRQVRLGEPVTTAPGEVWVAEHHPAPGRGGRRPDRGRVGPERAVGILPEALEQRLSRRQLFGDVGEAGSDRGRGGVRVVGHRRRSGHDLRHEHAGRGEQVGRVDAVPEVEGGGVRPDPPGPAAGRVRDPLRAADRAEVVVDPRDVAAHDGLRLAARAALGVAQQALHHPPVADVGEQRVGLPVARVQRHLVLVALPRAEVAGAFAARGQQRVGQRADRRLSGREPVPEPERAVVVGDDVRDAVLRAPDRRSVDAVGRAEHRLRGSRGR